MAYLNEPNATNAAVDIVKALAESGALKIAGSPAREELAENVGKRDGTYIAALVNTIYEGIREK